MALVGVAIGAMLLEASSEVIVESWGIEGTVFGATILTLFLTFENVMLTLEPICRGIPEIGTSHVIGSVIFSVTANVGIITFVGEVLIPRSVLVFHLPMVFVLTGIAALMVSPGESNDGTDTRSRPSTSSTGPSLSSSTAAFRTRCDTPARKVSKSFSVHIRST